MSLFFIFLLRKKMSKQSDLINWRLPPKCDYNNTLSVGPRPTKAKDLNEPEQCTIENASEYKLRA